MKATALPRIGITGRRMPVDTPFPLLEAVAIQATFVEATDRAGGLGCVLMAKEIDTAEAAAIVRSLDGLLLTGGLDVDPSLYGQEPHPELSFVDPVQDRFEMALALAALAEGTPLLCVCRGLQILNIAHGGTLDQHISDREDLGRHGIPLGGGGHLNTVTVSPDSTLAEVLGATTTLGECHHHQAVEQLGDGLEVVAATPDGVVEGLEPIESRGWVVAVQWHPEDTAAGDPQQQKLFDVLVEQARRFTA